MKTQTRASPKIYFTSDTHFGHANIIRYCQRPFAGPDEMDEALIGNWNAVVGDDDIVYHLGDFTLAGQSFARRIFARLRGRIRVLGYHWHHDRNWAPSQPGPSDYVGASGHAVEILPPLVVEKVRIAGLRRVLTMTHYPLAQWEASHRGGWHLHGHSHGTHRGDGPLLDVGVDSHGYVPVALSSLPVLLAGRERRA